MIRSLLLLCVLLGMVSHTSAHPFGQLAFDRVVRIQVAVDAVEVTYLIEVDANFVFQAVPKLDPDIDVTTLRGPKDFHTAFLQQLTRLLPDQLWAKLDQRDELRFTILKQKSFVREDQHLVAEFTLRAPVKLLPGLHQLRCKDFTFEDLPGLLAFEATVVPPIVQEKVQIPEKGELNEERRRLAVVDFRLNEPPPEPAPEPPPVVEVAPEPELSFWERLHRQGLPALFDSQAGLGILLVVAMLFGAAHAVTPGHGKTLVAAYLVGERGTIFHALMLGVIVTLTHTGSVIAVALVLRYLYPDTMPADVQTILGFIGGLLIAGLGFWMLLRRLAGRADHVHVFGGGHHHHHDHDHHHHHHHEELPAKLDRAGWIRLTMLGISGGIVPCTDAIALLGIAITSGRLALALPLLLAFSAGLAAVLVILGIMVVYAARYGAGQFRDRRWFRALPIISALVLFIVGLWICKASLQVG